MALELTELKRFTYLSILYHQKQRIFRLLYQDTTAYLKITENTCQLLDERGFIHEGEELVPLVQKVRAYEKIFGTSIPHEDLNHLLRLDEVEFLLNELNINDTELERRLAERLYIHLDQPYVKRFHQPLLLPRLLTNHEFVTNYLQTNIGLPEASDNYYNKLREMIEQIEEQTTYTIPDYFKTIQALLRYANLHLSHLQIVVLKTPFSSCIVRARAESLPDTCHQFKAPKLHNLVSVPVTNQMFYHLVQIYQELE